MEALKIVIHRHGREHGSFTHQSLNMTERYLGIALKPFVCASLYLATQLGNFITTILPSCLLDHLQLLQKSWSDHAGPHGFWELKRVHYNPKCSYFIATEHLLVKPWRSKSDNLGSWKLFTAVNSWISPCPLSHQEGESLQKGQDSSKRARWGTGYASKTWSPSVILLLLPRQISSPDLIVNHLTGFEETSWWNLSSALLIWLCVLSISHFLLLQNHQNPWILCIYILYSTSSRSWNPLCRFFKFFCLQLQGRSEKGGVATPLLSPAELGYHGIPGSLDPLCIRMAQIYQWMAEINLW